MSEDRQDVTLLTLKVAFILILLTVSLWVLRPFIPALVWATTIVIATWPLMQRLQARLWNKRPIAVILLTVTLPFVLVVPIWLAISTIADYSDEIANWVQIALSKPLPDLPGWINNLPLLGGSIAKAWQRIQASSLPQLFQSLAPYVKEVTLWFVGAVGGIGMVVIQFLLTMILAAFFFAKGEVVAAAVIRAGVALGGETGGDVLRFAARAIRGVALGVVVTALVQAIISGVALALVGVSLAPVLCAIVFMLCLAQIGPVPILIPMVIWLFTKDAGSATFLLLCSILAISVDNILRPMLIRKGADLPLLLIFGGVIGGLFAFGPIGIIAGPTVLAIAYKLLNLWTPEPAISTTGVAVAGDRLNDTSDDVGRRQRPFLKTGSHSQV